MAKRNDHSELIAQALSARERAYAPYSNYRVGAALLGKSGRIYTGCNVENASYGLTVCAERNAVFKAVSEGEREFQAIAVVTANAGSPCGACRQVLVEFLSPQARVVCANAKGDVKQEMTLGDLIPDSFTPEKLRAGQQAKD